MNWKMQNYISAKEAEEIFDDLTQTPENYSMKIPFIKNLKKCYMKVFFNNLIDANQKKQKQEEQNKAKKI